MKRLLVLLAMVTMTISARAEGFRLIAHPGVTSSTLSKSAVSALFLKKTAKWPDGVAVVPVDQAGRLPIRATFSTTVHGRSAAAITSYWQQQIFSGRSVPPLEEASDDKVLAHVRATPGAVGYVQESASTTGVKVITVQ